MCPLGGTTGVLPEFPLVHLFRILHSAFASGFLRDHSGPHGEAHQSRDVENVQGGHQLCAMVFDGLVADFQDRSDGLGGLAFGQQLEDLALARGQLLERAVERAICCRGNFLRNWLAISRLR